MRPLKQMLRLVLITALAALIPLTASAADYTLRVGSVAPEGTPWYKIVKKLKRQIQKKSDGRIKVKTFLGQALGGEKSVVRRCQQGKLEMIGVSSGAIATVVPELSAYELPYLFKNYGEADSALDATFQTAKKLMEEKGFVLYFWSENGFRDFATKDKFIRVPSDLAGMKMRAQESFVHTSMYAALGAKPNPIPVPQVAEDLANGVVSGYDNTKLYSYAAQWYTHVKYLTNSHHIYQPAVIAYNKKWLESLPKDLQDILLADAEKHTKRGRKSIRAMDRSMDALFKQGGVEFYTPSADERAKMAAATKSVYDTFRKRVGAAGSALLDEILKAR